VLTAAAKRLEMERAALAQGFEDLSSPRAPAEEPPAPGSDGAVMDAGVPPHSHSEDGAPAEPSEPSSGSDPSSSPPANEEKPRDATPSWEGMLRRTGVTSDRRRLGWIVALALVLTLALAICGGEESQDTTTGARSMQARADVGSAVGRDAKEFA
jgi:hypothetical protein